MTHRNKAFAIPADQLKRLTEYDVVAYATDEIMVSGKPVGFMYREEPGSAYDSGWRFFAGTEDQVYCDIQDNWGFYSINTICNYSEDIIPLLESATGACYARHGGVLVPRAWEPPDDDDADSLGQ